MFASVWQILTAIFFISALTKLVYKLIKQEEAPPVGLPAARIASGLLPVSERDSIGASEGVGDSEEDEDEVELEVEEEEEEEEEKEQEEEQVEEEDEEEEEGDREPLGRLPRRRSQVTVDHRFQGSRRLRLVAGLLANQRRQQQHQNGPPDENQQAIGQHAERELTEVYLNDGPDCHEQGAANYGQAKPQEQKLRLQNWFTALLIAEALLIEPSKLILQVLNGSFKLLWSILDAIEGIEQATEPETRSTAASRGAKQPAKLRGARRDVRHHQETGGRGRKWSSSGRRSNYFHRRYLSRRSLSACLLDDQLDELAANGEALPIDEEPGHEYESYPDEDTPPGAFAPPSS